MALRLSTPYVRCVRAYLPNLQAAVQHFRKFSSQYIGTSSQYVVEEPDITQVVWPDPALGPLCTVDRRFPLPGNVGIIHEVPKEERAPFPLDPEPSLMDAVITFPSQPEERHLGVLAQYFPDGEEDFEEFCPEEEIPKASDMLECAAYDCPTILRKDFADLFPDRNTMEGPFTVMTVSQHTENDMTTWSTEVQSEREVLLESFMRGAKEICDELIKNGFWADFIDPSSGKPAKGPHTNATLFETDERYRKFGLQIDDLGCCKVIHHPVWGTHAFVSCLFTNAPLDHPIISELVKSKSQTN